MDLKPKHLLLLLLALAFLTRFLRLSHPSKVVFDEAHYGLYGTKYLAREYYFDFHPPLGNMIYALTGAFGGAGTDFSFEPGSSYGDFPYLFFRAVPAFLGSLLVPLIYLFAREAGLSKRGSFFASLFVLFENSLVLESSLALINIFLVLFIFSALFFYLKSRKEENPLFIVLAGLFGGLASSVKLVGWGVFLFIFLLLLFRKKSLKKTLLSFLPFVVLGVLVYVFLFSFHLLWLGKECEPGDCGYVVEHLKEKMAGDLDLTEKPATGFFPLDFLKVQAYMLAGNLTLFHFSFYKIPSFLWPLMGRPFPYFIEAAGTKTSWLYLIGNPVLWGFSLLSLLFLPVNVFWKRAFGEDTLSLPEGALRKIVTGYLAFWIPFFLAQRMTLLYLYFPALIFSFLLFGAVFSSLSRGLAERKKAALSGALILLVLAGFLFFSPFTYGFPLTEKQFDRRMWLPGLWKPVPAAHSGKEELLRERAF